jgi:hypothetical protein
LFDEVEFVAGEDALPIDNRDQGVFFQKST